MKIFICFLAAISFFLTVAAQSVVVSNTSVPALDNSSMLEVRKPLKAKLNLRSMNFNDTSWLQFSNRNTANEGTDFNIVAIGENGLYFKTASDLINQVNDSLFTLLRNGSVGIGTKTPTQKLDVVGSLRIRDGSEAAGKTLQSDANGVASWRPKTFGFAATGGFPAISNLQTIPAGVNTQVTLINVEEYDNAGIYNPATNTVTIAEAGVYHIDANITYNNASNGNYSLSLVNSVGSTLRLVNQQVHSATFIEDFQLTLSTDIYCNAGQTLRLFTQQSSSNQQYIYGAFYTWFNMHKLY